MKMGNYCKAYLLKDFRQYSDWKEEMANARVEKYGNEIEDIRSLDDDSILYLQENYAVTDGIFIDQNIIFDNTSTEWENFCKETLKFEIPADLQ